MMGTLQMLEHGDDVPARGSPRLTSWGGTRRSDGRARRALVAVVVVLALATVGAQSPGARLLRYGFTTRLTYDVNPADARVASLVWARGIAKQVGIWDDVEAEVFPDVFSAADSVNAGKTDVLAMSTLEYLSIEDRLNAEPAMVFLQAGVATDEFLLLARDDIHSVSDLAGKRIGVFSASGQRELSSVWLDVLLMEAGIRPDSEKMPLMRPITKRSQAAMTVFFKQVDAAVELRPAFETAVELNPQLGRELKVLARSPGLLPGLVCLRNGMPPSVKRRYLEEAVRLHELPQFRQTFLLLRITRLMAWEARYLDSARALVAQRDALRKGRFP
jgi:ABC-type phosphate/phosphonate transport system substrate-binding protein